MVRGTEWENVHLENCLSDLDFESHELLRRTCKRLHINDAAIDENLEIVKAGAWRTNDEARRIAEIHVELDHTPVEERLDLMRELLGCHERFLEFRRSLKKSGNDPQDAG
jgi:DNA-binding GntR family transcriptional regulator